RKVYEVTILEFFKLNDLQLGTLYSILGTVFVVCYMPSGWLADRVRPRILISFSLVMTGALGYLYSTAPSYETLCVIYACWGVTTGL
ncbi:MFS transporter, partial [Chromohalobacter sp. HP20-39]